MNKVWRKILCVVLCAVLVLGCLGTASAGGKKKAFDPEMELFSTWYYVTDTIPEGMRYGANSFYCSALWDEDYFNQEWLTNCEVNFVSGDEALKDAMEVTTSERSDGHTGYTIRVNNEKLTVPGQAVFQVVLETESYIWDEKGTLVVLDYNEYPLVEEKQSNPVYEVQIGDTFADNQIMADIADVKAKDIAKAIGFKTKLVDIVQHSLGLEKSYDSDASRERIDSAIDIDYGSRSVGETESVATFKVKKYGVFHMIVRYELGNVTYRAPFTVSAEGFDIETYDKPVPGGKLQFNAYGSAENLQVTWSVDGEGASIDANGLLTIDASAPMGSVFTVKGVSSDGREDSKEVFLNDGILSTVEYERTRDHDGFQVPIPGGSWYNEDFDLWYGNGCVLSAENTGGRNREIMDGKVFWSNEDGTMMLEDPETAITYMREKLEDEESESVQELKKEYIEIDGHPALISAFTYYSDGAFYGKIGFLWYPRNTRILRVRVYSIGNDPETTGKVTLEDLKQFAAALKYDPATAPFALQDAELTITAKDSPAAVTAGKALQFKADFGNPEKVNNKSKNNGVKWSVLNAETGEEAEGITISDKGQLKVDKNLAAPVDLQVTATSTSYNTSAVYNLKALPVATKIEVEPTELFFYIGTEGAQTVKATLTPDTVPPVGITWTPSKKDIVEITDNGDGTASFVPLKAGKITVAVKEPGGKNAKLTVNVVDPVESVELALKGKVKAGGSVAVAATLLPKTAGNKTLEWSLDVGEDIAKIDAKGKVTIDKNAASGTKITVTCKALGAPEPVVSTIEIEVP